MEMNNGRFDEKRKGFNVANIAGDPFSLATIGIAIVRIHIPEKFEWLEN